MKINTSTHRSLLLVLVAMFFVLLVVTITSIASPTGKVFAQETSTMVTLDQLEKNPIIIYLVNILRFLVAGVSVVVVGTIIIGGIQYMTSQGSPQKTAAAREKVLMAVFALVLLALAVPLMQWLIPGGIFG